MPSNRSDGTESMSALLERIRGCELCAAELPLGPRPLLSADPSARVLIVGQAPGRRVHESGIPWDDQSGDRLRSWLAVERAAFYDARRFALVPMGFCYPGTGSAGDLPPRPECAPTWHGLLLARMPKIRLVVLLSQYAQRAFLGERCRDTLTETVRDFGRYGEGLFPLPHPSPRNNRWLVRNPWFERDVLPVLRARVVHALGAD